MSVDTWPFHWNSQTASSWLKLWTVLRKRQGGLKMKVKPNWFDRNSINSLPIQHSGETSDFRAISSRLEVFMKEWTFVGQMNWTSWSELTHLSTKHYSIHATKAKATSDYYLMNNRRKNSKMSKASPTHICSPVSCQCLSKCRWTTWRTDDQTNRAQSV